MLDASAVLALLFEEPGAETVEQRLAHAGICAANQSEVVAKLAERGAKAKEIEVLLAGVGAQTLTVDAPLAFAAGLLGPATLALGLSLGDRLCLATALSLEVPVLTTDRAWRELDIGARVEVIR